MLENENEAVLNNKDNYASKKTVVTAALIPIAATIPLMIKGLKDTYSATTIPVSAPAYIPPPTPSYLATALPSTNPEVLATPTGIIADSSLEMLANVLDPLIQLMVAISFPIASVIMVGSCFFFMLGNSEKAWSGIMSAGMGYVIIQMSPLFLEILRKVGEAV